jgi:hypothetical protein
VKCAISGILIGSILFARFPRAFLNLSASLIKEMCRESDSEQLFPPDLGALSFILQSYAPSKLSETGFSDWRKETSRLHWPTSILFVSPAKLT